MRKVVSIGACFLSSSDVIWLVDSRRIVPEHDPCRSERKALYECLEEDPRIDHIFEHCESCVTNVLPMKVETLCPIFEAIFCNALFSCPYCEYCTVEFHAFWGCILEVQSNFACTGIDCQQYARVPRSPSPLLQHAPPQRLSEECSETTYHETPPNQELPTQQQHPETRSISVDQYGRWSEL